jgi:hypothetical protein
MMRVHIKPVEVDGQFTDVGEVSVAVSSSVAVRVVPVVDDVPVESAAFGVVGASGQPDVDVLLGAMGEALSVFLEGRGV